MLTVAELLLKIDNEYNGHKQTTINGLSLKQAKQICKDLEKLTDNEHSFVVELWTDGSMTIYQKDFFPAGTVGGTDRIILGIDN